MGNSNYITRLGNVALGLIMFAGICACSDAQTSSDAARVDIIPTDISVDTAPMIDVVVPPCQEDPDGTACDDGDPCTLDDACAGGVCVGGTSNPCEAANPCNIGSCVPNEGCVYEPREDGSPCSVACFVQASCQEGACKVNPDSAIQCPQPSVNQPCVAELLCDPANGECTVEVLKGSGSVCDTDGNYCTVENCDVEGVCQDMSKTNNCAVEKGVSPCDAWTCHPKTGECVSNGFVGEISCNDGNGCTGNDTCKQDEFGFTACQGTALDVDDGNPCTNDTCIDGVIAHDPIDQLPCDPKDPCSDTGLCQQGVCEADEPCACELDSDCPQPDNLCLGKAICDKSGEVPQCAIDASTVIECPPSSKVCYTSKCVPALGECVESPAPANTPCDDNNVCSGGDSCQNGVCKAGAPVTCDDGVFCNGLEFCDPVTGCTPGTPPQVDDGISCTQDSCDEAAGVVLHVTNDAACDDQVFCNGKEVCHPAQGCISTDSVIIDDGLSCTADSCDEINKEVLHVPSDAACDNGLFCDGKEVCDLQAGCKSGVSPPVDDGIPCTTDICDESLDVVTHTPVNALCDNGLLCDGKETCDAQAGCLPDPNVSIDDGVDCTLDICDDATGQITHVPDHAACSDGLFCNGAEVCDVKLGCIQGEAPEISDGIACTQDACDEALDIVTHIPDPAACTNGVYCDGVEVCDIFSGCQPGSPIPLDDGIDCTIDSCDEATDSVIHTPVHAACDNGLFCDGEEKCDLAQGCVPSNSPPVSDGVGCTTDTCDEATDTVKHVPNHLLCDNGLYCDGVEVCDLTQGCQSGAPVDTDDGHDCTQDICDELNKKVVHLPIDSLCDDGLYCNGEESCNTVFGCMAGDAPLIPDGVACTVDTCDESTDSFIYVPDDTKCGNAGPCMVGTCDAIEGCKEEAVAPCCGNGIKEEGELCDDANIDAGDGCFACKYELPANCKQWLELDPEAQSGLYDVDPDGATGAPPFEVWCDMETDGGGWTIFMAASTPLLVPTLQTNIDPNQVGYSYMPYLPFKSLAQGGMRVRAWAIEKPELWLECDFQSASDDYKTWKAGVGCVQRMRLKETQEYIEIPFIITGRGFLYSGIWDSIAPEDPVPESENTVFTKPNGFDGKWAVPGWNSFNEGNFFKNSDYQDFYGEWTDSYTRRIVYAIR